jgi:hypothetical protein
MQEQQQQPNGIELPSKSVSIRLVKGQSELLQRNDVTFHDWAILAAKADVMMRETCPDAEPDWTDKEVTFQLHADGVVTREGGELITLNEWHAMLWISNAAMQRNLYMMEARAEQQQIQMARMTKNLIAGHR